MNGKDLLIGLGEINHKYYDEAENESISNFSAHKRIRKPILIAAIIALTAVLVGCVAAYALRLQDMSIGKETYTQSFDDSGKAIEPTEKTRDIITLYGHSGDPIQLALTEWYDFLETYDPDGKLMDNNPDHPEIPNQYEFTYGCYTQEKVNKVNEIAAKYDLKLLEECIPFQQWQSDIFFEETGIDSFLLPDCNAKISHVSGMYYPPYNFNMDYTLDTDKMDIKLYGSIVYARKDYLPGVIPGGLDLNLFEQWDHTSPGGTPLLLALSNRGSGYIIAEQDNAMLILHLDGNFSGSTYPKEDEIITKAQLEMVADLFDYSISPRILDRTYVEQKLKDADQAHETENAYVPAVYGSFSEYIKDNFRVPKDNLQYTFYDLTGDGKGELLIGQNGAFNQWVTIRDGEALAKFLGETYLCEGGVLENYSAYEIFEDHMYLAPVSETVIDDLDVQLKQIINLQRTRDQWTQTKAGEYTSAIEVTQEEAIKIIEQYPRIELDWKPLIDYPLSEGFTLSEYLEEKDVRVSNEELREVYKQHLNESENMHYSHYRILDINGDGVDDLLLKGEDDTFIGKTDYYWIALTYRYGEIMGFAADFYLCEDGVLEKVDTRHAGDFGVEKNGHQFLRCNEFEEELFEFVAYNKATASWQTDWWDEEPITAEEANAILAKYPRIDQGMRPIAELLN